MKSLSMCLAALSLLLTGGCDLFTAGDDEMPRVHLAEPLPFDGGPLSGSFRLKATAEDDHQIQYVRIQFFKARLDKDLPEEVLYDWTIWPQPSREHVAIDTLLTLPAGLVLVPGPHEKGRRYLLNVSAGNGKNGMGVGRLYTARE